MKRKLGILTIGMMIILIVPEIGAFEPEEGFYAEYKLFGKIITGYKGEKELDLPYNTAMTMFFGDRSTVERVDIVYTLYRYQILNNKENKAEVRICLEGKVLTNKWENGKEILLPFKRIYDLRLDLGTLELLDENGEPWGKWPFWIPIKKYDEEYTMLKNLNNHGEVKGWLKGPFKLNKKEKDLISPYLTRDNSFKINFVYKKDGELIYPGFEKYGIKIPESWKDNNGEGNLNWHGHELYVCMGSEGYYNADGIFCLTVGYLDDILVRKLQVDFLVESGQIYLADCGVKEEILIEPPKEKYQHPLSYELKQLEELNSPERSEPPQSPEEDAAQETESSETAKSETAQKSSCPPKSPEEDAAQETESSETAKSETAQKSSCPPKSPEETPSKTGGNKMIVYTTLIVLAVIGGLIAYKRS